MGMYTQIRGWLNVDSIGYGDRFYAIKDKLEQAKYDFQNSELTLDRKWVSNDTNALQGGNGDEHYINYVH